jgi:peroxiredoxin
MVVDDGVVKALNVEEGGEFRVSAAEHMLQQL